MGNRMVPFFISLSAGFWPHLTSWLGCLSRQVPARDQGWCMFHNIAPVGGNESIWDLDGSMEAYLASYGHVVASLVAAHPCFFVVLRFLLPTLWQPL
jgi:hypothetical protein